MFCTRVVSILPLKYATGFELKQDDNVDERKSIERINWAKNFFPFIFNII